MWAIGFHYPKQLFFGTKISPGRLQVREELEAEKKRLAAAGKFPGKISPMHYARTHPIPGVSLSSHRNYVRDEAVRLGFELATSAEGHDVGVKPDRSKMQNGPPPSRQRLQVRKELKELKAKLVAEGRFPGKIYPTQYAREHSIEGVSLAVHREMVAKEARLQEFILASHKEGMHKGYETYKGRKERRQLRAGLEKLKNELVAFNLFPIKIFPIDFIRLYPSLKLTEKGAVKITKEEAIALGFEIATQRQGQNIPDQILQIMVKTNQRQLLSWGINMPGLKVDVNETDIDRIVYRYLSKLKQKLMRVGKFETYILDPVVLAAAAINIPNRQALDKYTLASLQIKIPEQEKQVREKVIQRAEAMDFKISDKRGLQHTVLRLKRQANLKKRLELIG